MVPICGPWQYAPAHTSYYFVDGKRVKLYHDAVGNDQTEFTTGGEQRYYGMYPSVISYRTYRITPVLYHLVGPAEFNDRVFSYKPDTNKGEIPFSVQSGLEAKGKVSINASSRGIGIYSMNYRFPVNVLKIVGKPGRVDETEEDLGTYYSESVFSCYIPATKILYAGYESDAPPEAKTIADEELSLD
jgi:hypothetical protein